LAFLDDNFLTSKIFSYNFPTAQNLEATQDEKVVKTKGASDLSGLHKAKAKAATGQKCE